MTTFLCVRHAAHDNVGAFLAGRTPGIHLGEAGRRQAQRRAASLAHETLDAIHTSPRERTRETAEALAAGRGLVPTAVDALDEIDFGTWSNRTFEDLRHDPDWRRWNETRSLMRTPAADTMLAVQARVVRHVADACLRAPAATIALVTHADVIKTLLAYHLGLALDMIGRFDIAPASVSRLRLEPWGAQVLSVNEPCPDEAADAGARP